MRRGERRDKGEGEEEPDRCIIQRASDRSSHLRFSLANFHFAYSTLDIHVHARCVGSRHALVFRASLPSPRRVQPCSVQT